ncbi:MAG: hypothetical protein QXS24_02585 [Desulfurococcaceae archaeon]
MSKVKVSIVTQNFNSNNYLPISMLSLYSAFKTLAKLSDFIDGRVLLIDNASFDGSYEKLSQLGSRLSKEMSINFESRRFGKDLGNSFAITYGFLLEKKRGAKYILNIDNDFIILYPNIVKEMIDTAEKFNSLKIKYHAITTMYIIGNRDVLLKNPSFKHAQDLDEIMNFVREEAERSKLLAPNINYVNVLNQSFTILPVMSREEFNNIILKKENLPEFLLSSHVPASFTLYNPNSAPMYPYFYITGDDISCGLENAKRGYFSVVLTKTGGIHYVTTQQKANNVRLYYGFRNIILYNSLKGHRKALHEFLWFIYSAPYSIINALNIKQLIKRRLVKNEPLINPSTSVKSNPRVAKYAVLGVLHGIMEDHYFRKKTEQWFDKFIPRADIDYLDYLRLDYSTWSGGSFSLKDLLLYLIMPDKAVRKDVGINILIRRLKN